MRGVHRHKTQKEKLSAVTLAKKRGKKKKKEKPKLKREKDDGTHSLGVKDVGKKIPSTRMQTPGTD